MPRIEVAKNGNPGAKLSPSRAEPISMWVSVVLTDWLSSESLPRTLPFLVLAVGPKRAATAQQSPFSFFFQRSLAGIFRFSIRYLGQGTDGMSALRGNASSGSCSMLAYPKVDLSLDRLNRDGWAMGIFPSTDRKAVCGLSPASAASTGSLPRLRRKRQPGGSPGVRRAAWKSSALAAARRASSRKASASAFYLAWAMAA